MGMMSHISFIAFRILGLDLHVLLGMCVLLCEHGIACTLRWGVTLVRVYFTRFVHLVVGPLTDIGSTRVNDAQTRP